MLFRSFISIFLSTLSVLYWEWYIKNLLLLCSYLSPCISYSFCFIKGSCSAIWYVNIIITKYSLWIRAFTIINVMFRLWYLRDKIKTLKIYICITFLTTPATTILSAYDDHSIIYCKQVQSRSPPTEPISSWDIPAACHPRTERKKKMVAGVLSPLVFTLIYIVIFAFKKFTS